MFFVGMHKLNYIYMTGRFGKRTPTTLPIRVTHTLNVSSRYSPTNMAPKVMRLSSTERLTTGWTPLPLRVRARVESVH